MEMKKKEPLIDAIVPEVGTFYQHHQFRKEIEDEITVGK